MSVYIVAEIGINHNGSLDNAKKLIEMAKSCGCDAVKFQKRTIDIVYSQELLDSFRESPWGKTQREQKMGLEFGEDEFDIISEYCEKLEIDWFASAWDIPSQEFLQRYDLIYNKVASAMTTHPDFLNVVAKEGKKTFLSVGMCDWKEVDQAVEIFNNQKCPLVLLHTVSEYPADEDKLNLMNIETLRNRYGLPVGYSGHESSVTPSVIAVASMGAEVVERHITLNRAMYGSDQAASLEEVGLDQMVSQIRKIPIVLGSPDKQITEKEHEIARKLRYW